MKGETRTISKPTVETADAVLDPVLISRIDCCRILGGVCLRTVDKLIAEKKLPVRRIGKRVLIPRAALEKFAK